MTSSTESTAGANESGRAPVSVRLTQVLFGVLGLSTGIEFIRLFGASSSVMAAHSQPSLLAVAATRTFIVLVAAIYSIVSLQRRWTYARASSVASLVLLFIISLLDSSSTLRWREVFSLSGAEARGNVLGHCLFFGLTLILALRLLIGTSERQYLG